MAQKFDIHTSKWRFLLLFLGGALAALPVSFTQVSALAFVAFIPTLLFLFSELRSPALPRKARAYYGYGLLFCMGYFMVTFHWFISLYPLDFVGGMTPILAVMVILAACIGLPLLQSLGFAVLFYLLAWLSRTSIVRRHSWLLPLLFACGWVTLAYTQTLTWAGVPWGAQLALSQHQNLLVVSSASFFGSYFVTFIIAAVNAFLAYAFLAQRKKERARERMAALVALGLFLFNLGLGTVAHFLPQAESGRVKAAVLQGNISSADKWDDDASELSVYRELAKSAAAQGAKIIVWPETAIPYYLSENDYAMVSVMQTAHMTNTIQIVGSYSYKIAEDGSKQRYNSLYLVYPSGEISETLYHKRHPVPFGEYVPMEQVIRTCLPFLSNLSMLQDDSDVLPGTDPALFDTEYGMLGGLICFDTIYADLARESVAAGAELLVIGTNDSWFFDSAAVYQHNGQAVLRAIENGRAVLRAANTGISSIITEKGEIFASLDPLVAGQLTAEVSLSTQKTLYTHIGDSFVVLAALAFHLPFCISLFGTIRKKFAK